MRADASRFNLRPQPVWTGGRPVNRARVTRPASRRGSRSSTRPGRAWFARATSSKGRASRSSSEPTSSFRRSWRFVSTAGRCQLTTVPPAL